ncbi:MAG: type II secretion system F family protein [Candidatus Omnitrophota bacterium]
MPRYLYSAKIDPQKTIQGDIEAESEQEAINKLTQKGYFPISVVAESSVLNKQSTITLRKVSRKDVALFTEQLSNLLDSGVNILNGLKIISAQSPNKYLKVVLNDVTNRIKDGNSFSDSLAAHPRVFPEVYSSLIRTGEASGNLKETVKRLSCFLEKEEEFKNSLVSSLTYPLFVFAVGVATVAVLLVFVIPRLVSMFEDMGQALPLPTLILINTSSFLRNYWWLILAIIFILFFSLRRVYRTPQGRFSLDKTKLKVYLVGPVILKTEISRLSRTLSLLFTSGMPITSSLDISTSVLENQVLKKEVKKFIDQISGGASFSSVIKTSKYFPDFVVNIISIGEETGSLGNALMRIAEVYEKDVDRTLKALTRMLEPVIILVMGLVVGFIVLSMLLPIFQINLIVR